MTEYLAFHTPNQAGCWSADTLIKMGDGTLCPAKDVLPGDTVLGNHRVRTVVRTELNRKVKMVRLTPNLLITPWHPVKPNAAAQWKFPAHISVAEGKPVPEEPHLDYVYNLVLYSGHTVNVDGYEICTLAHGFQGQIVGHLLYGTPLITEKLSKEPGWEDGFITLRTPLTL